ncbi:MULTISPECIES: FtsW/RodA/SpoVE family cell cycle protein [Sinomonas]|jgi:cell division protein FtsW (lipid II flippase)|uniref:FtsW/RodA/SpoVE family cell cycle protein n=1 Tax=Sinomonas flava TaxID=496857 RepID=A0ABP5NNY5_9MICC|nr:FtsW/RodA/SpoVE family cell cycle protein [Sinomonas sp. R1AF57]ASN53668.1 cell division protein [Sinomonas sp. R1AF57]
MSGVDTVQKPRRNAELVLLILALAVGIGASAMTGVKEGTALDRDFWLQSALLAGASLAVHTVLRFRAKYADPIILPLVVTLNGLGLAMIHRLDTPETDYGNAQARWTIIGMVLAVAVIWFLRDHRYLRRYTYISLILSAVLLLLPLVPGISAGEVNGAQVWIRFGSASFQPGEVAKITIAIFFAGYLSTNRDLILLAGRRIGRLQLPRFRDLGPMVVTWLGAIGILIFQHDLGMSILFFGIFISMIYIATSRASWALLGVLLMFGGAMAASVLLPHIRLRIDGWLNAFSPEVYGRTYGSSYQVIQGLFGMANGGLLGTGLGEGRPDLVPFPHSDMIIASFGEELGLVGLFAIIMCYALLITRGFRAALGARDSFGKLLAAGLSAGIALQCFVVIGGVTRLIPLTGLTTPFLAAGGSSLLANWIIVALLLVISNAARRPVDMTPLDPNDAAGPAPRSRLADLTDRVMPPRRRRTSTHDDTQTEAVRIR